MRSFHGKHNTSNLEEFYPMGFRYSTYKFFSYRGVVQKGQTPFTVFRSKINLLISGRTRNFYTLPVNNAKYHYGQVVWNRICLPKGYRNHYGQILPPVGQIARAVSLHWLNQTFLFMVWSLSS